MKKHTKQFGTVYVPPQAQVFQLRLEMALLTASESEFTGSTIDPGEEVIWNVPIDFGSIL